MKYRICMWVLFIFPILGSLTISPGAYAQEDVDPVPLVPEGPRVLSLDECLAIGFENNLGLRQVRLGTEAGILERIRNESAYDPGFELDLSTQHSDSPASSDSSGSSSSSSQIDLTARYSLPTWSGGTWVFSLNQGRSSGTSTIGGETSDHTSHSSQVGVAYNLPLLEGHGERVNRFGVQKADIGVMRSEIAVTEAERSTRLAIIEAYIYAVLAARSIEVTTLSLETADNLVLEVQARINVGQLAPYELLAAQAGLAERREALLNSETVLATSLDTLKEIIGLPITDEVAVDPYILQPVYLEVDPDDLFIFAQQNRNDLQDIDLRTEQAQIDLLLATDRRQSSLFWNTILGLAGRGDDYGESVTDMEHLTWYTGLEYRIPLGGNRAAEVDVSAAELALDRLELERIDFLRVLQRDIRSAVEGFNNALLRIDVTAQGLEVQEVKMESERARLELGLITSRDLLEFDVDFANARLAYDSALADTLIALARLEYLVNAPLVEDAVVIGNILSETVGTATGEDAG